MRGNALARALLLIDPSWRSVRAVLTGLDFQKWPLLLEPFQKRGDKSAGSLANLARFGRDTGSNSGPPAFCLFNFANRLTEVKDLSDKSVGRIQKSTTNKGRQRHLYQHHHHHHKRQQRQSAPLLLLNLTRSCSSSCSLSRELSQSRLPGSREPTKGKLLNRLDQDQGGETSARNDEQTNASRVTRLSEARCDSRETSPNQGLRADSHDESRRQDRREQAAQDKHSGLHDGGLYHELEPLKRASSYEQGTLLTGAHIFSRPDDGNCHQGQDYNCNCNAESNHERGSSASGNKLAATYGAEDYGRILWRAARDYQPAEHYDYSLFGLNVHLDKAVARHQRETMLYNQDRHLKEEQAKLVAPNLKQSPIAIMSVNPAYELHNKPLIFEYPATVDNLRLNNTGFSWEVKIPYQISMTTALYGAHLNQAHRYRLDQFHCHWGENSKHGGSEHTVDNHVYSAEMHFVHYNMDKYHTLSKAARHPDGLVVLSVFIDAHADHHNHAELEKIVSHLKLIQLKGDHSIIRQAVRLENLLPQNRSYWSYQGSLTTPPYLESVTWFVLKYPIRCNVAQIEKFKSLSSSVRRDDEPVFIRSNFRKTQPLNGRTIVTYDEPSPQMALRNS